ncbi:MAG: hypothetical protein HY835_11820, partial [Anaerolineae bacterium]|nr:hypothetical protein [Anaerolineae bacterium]
MSAGLFARLARRARGETGGLQPLIPPIFAGGPTSTGLVEEEMQTPVRAQPMPAPTAQPPPAQPGPGILDH